MPDTWQVVKLTAKETGEVHYRLMCGWYGGFTQGDSWRMSSGIEKIIDEDTHWRIPQHSGSVYVCHKNNERLSGFAANTLNHIIETSTVVDIELVKISDILTEYG